MTNNRSSLHSFVCYVRQMSLQRILLVILVVGVAQSEDCALEGSCAGGRPRTPIGCCPVGVGKECGESVGVECDTELGYRCLDSTGNLTTDRGECQGLFNLHVTEAGERSVVLEWQDFRPATYQFEYVLLYREDVFLADTSKWTIQDIGSEPRYTLQKLSPGTEYFVRVAIWADPYDSVLGNMSEALFFRTLAASYCSHNSEQYEVGQTTSNCEERCTCEASGQFSCAPLCPASSLPAVPEGCTLKFTQCSCNVTVQCSDAEAGCEFEGREYQAGVTVELECRTCRCHRGTMTCSYPEDCEMREASPECPEPVAVPSSETCCPVWSCGEEVTHRPVEATCEYNGTTHADGDTWADNVDCTRCACENGRVNCFSQCEEPVAPTGCSNPKLKRSELSCCEIIECEGTEEEQECTYNGTTYHLGELFTSQCALCMCGQRNIVNCSVSQCPPLQLSLPTIYCPFPHVRRTGCCDTMGCIRDDIDLNAMMDRLMAISYDPDSLTISFDVDHVTSSGSVTSDRYEVMTLESGVNNSEWSSRTYTPVSVNSDENASSPTDILHHDAAIRVDDRVFITLDGLNPDTEYYVRVQPVIKRDVGETAEPSNKTITGFIVAKTMKKDLSCHVDGKTYADGSVVGKNCGEVCTCVRGHVRCESACPEEDTVMAPSATCPVPKLVGHEGSCCKIWKCFPEEGGCRHGELILQNGEQLYEGACERKCTCTEGEVVCRAVCPPVSPAPRPQCVLINLTTTCCPVWMCPQEKREPVGMSLAMLLGFNGYCPDADLEQFKLSAWSALVSRLAGQMPCAVRESRLFIACHVTQVVVTCPEPEAYRRKRRQASVIAMTLVVSANYSESSTAEKVESSLRATESSLRSTFTSIDLSLQLDGDHNLTSTRRALTLGYNYTCDSEFFYVKDACVPDGLVPQAPRHDLPVTVTNVTHNSVTLEWPSLDFFSLGYVTGLVVEHRLLAAHHWNRSATLPRVATQYTVTSLRSSQHYVARVVVLTNSTFPQQGRLPMTPVQFTTKPHEVLNGQLTIDAIDVGLGQTSVTISWRPLTSDVAAVITNLTLAYRKSQNTDDVQNYVLDPRATLVSLVGLQSATPYLAKFLVLLINGTTVEASTLHFVTGAEDHSDLPLIPLLVTSAVIIILATLLPVSFYVWRRMRRKSRDTAFENKAYGVPLPKNTDISHAKDHDTLNGNVSLTKDDTEKPQV